MDINQKIPSPQEIKKSPQTFDPKELNQLRELRDKINPACRVWIRMIRQESNYNEWDNYYDFWRKYTSDVDRIYYHNILVKMYKITIF